MLFIKLISTFPPPSLLAHSCIVQKYYLLGSTQRHLLAAASLNDGVSAATVAAAAATVSSITPARHGLYQAVVICMLLVYETRANFSVSKRQSRSIQAVSGRRRQCSTAMMCAPRVACRRKDKPAKQSMVTSQEASNGASA